SPSSVLRGPSRVRYLLLFFLHRLLALPALHSFPTRRSSDLAFDGAQAALVAVAEALGQHRLDLEGEKLLGAAGVEVKEAAHGPRSEEHTSELQSRENLVCRLLLEKKNRIKRN